MLRYDVSRKAHTNFQIFFVRNVFFPGEVLDCIDS